MRVTMTFRETADATLAYLWCLRAYVDPRKAFEAFVRLFYIANHIAAPPSEDKKPQSEDTRRHDTSKCHTARRR